MPVGAKIATNPENDKNPKKPGKSQPETEHNKHYRTLLRGLNQSDQSDLIGDAWKINPNAESQDVATQEIATEPDSPISAREENANRALRGAVHGLLFAPLHLYVFYLLLFKVFASDEPIRLVYTRRAWQAAAINIPYTVVILIVIRWTIYSL